MDKKKVLVNVRIECEMPHIPFYARNDQEAIAAYLEEWARDFNDFIRDHRSQDKVSLYIEREYEEEES